MRPLAISSSIESHQPSGGSSAVPDAHRDLSEALRRYEEAAGAEALIRLNSKQQWTWDEVLKEGEGALEEYYAAGQGAKGAVRRLFRSLGDKEPVLSPWLGFIPQDSYLSTLHAGLTLVFAVGMLKMRPRSEAE